MIWFFFPSMSKIPPKVIDAGLEVAQPLRVEALCGGVYGGCGAHLFALQTVLFIDIMRRLSV
ncbi:MAG: hypothetical protein LBC59_05935 [Chitinispirillales bacterium]|jgi:hypothetical protein|nr:hypothetical protein [Chitinispirillales bacterium]